MHVELSSAEPSQLEPEHALLLTVVPEPQVALQLDQTDHADHESFAGDGPEFGWRQVSEPKENKPGAVTQFTNGSFKTDNICHLIEQSKEL